MTLPYHFRLLDTICSMLFETAGIMRSPMPTTFESVGPTPGIIFNIFFSGSLVNFHTLPSPFLNFCQPVSLGLFIYSIVAIAFVLLSAIFYIRLSF